MRDLTLGNMNFGFALFAVAVCIWASIDYNRFIKFWMLRPAPYTQRVKVVFRFLFLACVIGGLWRLVEIGKTTGRPALSYLRALPFAAAWFVVFFLMLRIVEWMARKRSMKQ